MGAMALVSEAAVRQGVTVEATKALFQGQPIAALSGVTKKYGATTALDGLNLSLHAGEVVALLGPNGAGKSTAVRTRIGAMLQVARVTDALKVREHVDLFRSYYPRPLPAAEVMSIAKLEGVEDRLFGKLSGGQKQRVLFALAMCGDPDLIFLDEPTVGMDIEARRGLWQQIRSLADRGKTVLLTTHYLEEADALADRVIVINKGHAVSEGTPAEIKRMSGGKRIRCSTKLATSFLQGLPGVTSVEHTGEFVTVTATNPEAAVRAMLLNDEQLSGLEIASPALEDAFLALTQAK